MTSEVSRPFLALGVPLLQGYGMTESSPVISCNTPEDNDPTSVGRALRGVAVRIGDRDELLARGDNIMLGYWHRPDDTALARDPDGWLHTGDQAQLENGRIILHTVQAQRAFEKDGGVVLLEPHLKRLSIDKPGVAGHITLQSQHMNLIDGFRNQWISRDQAALQAEI